MKKQVKKLPKFVKRNIYAQAGVIIVIGAVIAAAIIATKQETASTTKTVSSEQLTKCQKTPSFKCYNDYFVAYTNQTSPEGAFAVLKKIYDTDSYAKSQCHQISHSIGHAAYDKYKDLGTAYPKGDSFCWSGYHHGVTERAIAELGPDKIRSQANEVCQKLAVSSKYSFDHFNCVHGLGHGFMAVERYNLFTGLKDCDIIKDGWERESCYGGAFMENVMVASRGDGTSDYLRPNELMYPCTAVDYAYKQQCYLMQTSYILQQNGYNFGDAFRLCRDVADSAFVTTCYQSVGRDASGSTVSDVPRTLENCNKALDDQGLENCMYGAVRDFVSYYHDDKKAYELCNGFKGSIAEKCKSDVKVYYSTF